MPSRMVCAKPIDIQFAIERKLVAGGEQGFGERRHVVCVAARLCCVQSPGHVDEVQEAFVHVGIYLKPIHDIGRYNAV